MATDLTALDALPRLLALVARVFPVAEVLAQPADAARVIAYYSGSASGFDRFHSAAGAVHLGLAPTAGEPADHGFQARWVAAALAPAAGGRVLEVGCGKGHDLWRLARDHPRTAFFGLDLTPRHLAAARRRLGSLPNAGLARGSYLELPHREASFDGVYAVECLCHAGSSEEVLAEIRRVLRPGGRLVVFDGFRGPAPAGAPPETETAMRLIEAAMAVPRFHELPAWLAAARAAGLEPIEVEDLSAATLPDLARLQRLARVFFAAPPLGRALARWMGTALALNAIAGLLMPLATRAGIQRYARVVLERPPAQPA